MDVGISNISNISAMILEEENGIFFFVKKVTKNVPKNNWFLFSFIIYII